MSMNYSSTMDANVHSQHQQYYTMVAPPPPPPTSFQHFHHHQHQQQQQQHQTHHGGGGISSPPQTPAFFQHQHFQAGPALSPHTTLYELPPSMTGSYQVHTMPLTLVTAPPSTLGPGQPHGAASYMAPPPPSFQAAHHHHYAPEAYHHQHHHAHYSSSQGLVPQQHHHHHHHHHFGAAASLSNLNLQLNSPTAVLPTVPTHSTAVVRSNDSHSAALLSNPPICEAIPPPSPNMLPTTPPQHPRHDIIMPVEVTSTRALSFASCRQQRSMKRLEIPPALPGDPEPGPRQLIVNYLALDIGSAELFELFTPYGEVEMARVATDTATGRSIGYGFVFMRRHADAMRAVEHASGRVLLGKRVRVSFAVPQRPVHEATHRHGAVFGAPHVGTEASLQRQ